jgi:serine/threonine protein kinase
MTTQDTIDKAVFEGTHTVTYCSRHNQLKVHGSPRDKEKTYLAFSKTLSDNVDQYTTKCGNASLVLKRLGEDDQGERAVVAALSPGAGGVVRSRAINDNLIVMEPMQGDLAELLRKRELTPAEICSVMKTIVAQIKYLRSLTTEIPYIYTDIKLENILYRVVGGRLIVKLGDLGGAYPSNHNYRTTFPCYTGTDPPHGDDDDRWFNIPFERADACVRELLHRLLKLLKTQGKSPVYDPVANTDDLRKQEPSTTDPVKAACTPDQGRE